MLLWTRLDPLDGLRTWGLDPFHEHVLQQFANLMALAQL
jgi:hypothetical protein